MGIAESTDGACNGIVQYPNHPTLELPASRVYGNKCLTVEAIFHPGTPSISCVGDEESNKIKREKGSCGRSQLKQWDGKE